MNNNDKARGGGRIGRYYRWQFRWYLRCLGALRLIPAPVERALQRRLVRGSRGGA